MYLALSLAKLEDFENSCAAYAKAIEMNKNDPIAYLNFAITLQKYEEDDKAREMLQAYKQFAALVPSDSDDGIDDDAAEMAEKLEVLLEG